jgi:hypothetical protein
VFQDDLSFAVENISLRGLIDIDIGGEPCAIADNIEF